MKIQVNLLVGMAFLLAAISFARADEPSDQITIKQIFTDKRFKTESFGPYKWLENGRFYTTVENVEVDQAPAADDDKKPDDPQSDTDKPKDQTPRKQIVKYETATGQSTVLVTAEQLTPAGAQRSSGDRQLRMVHRQAAAADLHEHRQSMAAKYQGGLLAVGFGERFAAQNRRRGNSVDAHVCETVASS